eukprot:5489743-Karenia_brevis.AAC.1
MNQQRSAYYLHPRLSKGMKLQQVALQCWSDGGHRRRGCSASAAVVKAWHCNHQQPMVVIAATHFMQDEGCDS